MARTFEALASEARKSWNDDARQVHDAASEVFGREIRMQVLVGRQLAEARRGAGMTQPALAAASGVDQAEISRIENGNANPTLETISRLATVLGQTLQLSPHATPAVS